MKLKTITTYVLVCLLTRGNWNLVLPAKGDGDGNGSGSSAETPANGSAEATSEDSTSKADGLASVESSEATPANGSSNGSSNGSTANGSSEATPANGSANGSSAEATPEGEARAESIESMLASQVAEDSALEGDLRAAGTENSSLDTDQKTSVPDTEAERLNTALRLLKPYKDDGNGVAVEMVLDDLFRDYYKGHLTYAFKKGVRCVSVKLGEADVWKTGEREVGEPKSVTLNVELNSFTVRDANKEAYFKKDATASEWQYVATFPRRKMFVAEGAKTSGSGETREASTVPSTDPAEANGLSKSPDANESSDATDANESSDATDANETSQSTDPDQASEDANGSSVPAAE